MSAIPPKADMVQHRCNVRFVPKADILRRSKKCDLFDHLVGDSEEIGRNCEMKRFGRLKIDSQIEFCRLLDW
jgi:hypothetical protein